MWKPKTKRGKSLKNWHSKAWMVDPKKTKIVIVSAGASTVVEGSERGFNDEFFETPVVVIDNDGFNIDDNGDSKGFSDEISAVRVSFVLGDT